MADRSRADERLGRERRAARSGASTGPLGWPGDRGLDPPGVTGVWAPANDRVTTQRTRRRRGPPPTMPMTGPSLAGHDADGGNSESQRFVFPLNTCCALVTDSAQRPHGERPGPLPHPPAHHWAALDYPLLDGIGDPRGCRPEPGGRSPTRVGSQYQDRSHCHRRGRHHLGSNESGSSSRRDALASGHGTGL